MNKPNINVIALAVGLALSAQSMAAELSAADYAAAEQKIAADLTNAKSACASLTGNASEICIVEAKGKNAVAMADLEAKNDPSPEMAFAAQIARAEAAYAVAKERCDDTEGTVNSNCLQSAKTAHATAKANADKEMKLHSTTSQVNPNATASPGDKYNNDVRATSNKDTHATNNSDIRADDRNDISATHNSDIRADDKNDLRATNDNDSNDMRATDTLFDFDSADLRAAGRATLDDFVDKSKENSSAQINVVGYTDRLGDDAYNQQLSEQRTEVVKDYLVSEGIDASRISAEGKGHSQPNMTADECQGERSAAVIACLQPDRRVVVSMTEAVSSN